MAAGPMSDRIRSPQFDAWRVNLARVRKRDKPRDPIVCRVRKARRADLVDPAGALGARTQGGVAARPQGTLLSLRQNLRPNYRRTGLVVCVSTGRRGERSHIDERAWAALPGF